MKPTHKKTLDSMKKFSTLLALNESGFYPAEIKSSVIRLLDPYFSNKSILKELAIELLVPEAINFGRLSEDPWSKRLFEQVFEIYKKSRAANESACLDGAAANEQKLQHALSEYWSSHHLEVEKSALDLNEFKYEVFRNIGTIVEACIQPLLKELLLQVRIAAVGPGPVSSTDLEAMDLGVAVDQLIRVSGFPELFAPPPWGIKLNQWRNMAQHHKTRVESSEIVGVYGKPPNTTEVHLKRDEVLSAVRKIYSVYSILRTARSLFLLDNIDVYRPRVGPLLNVREEVDLVSLATALATHGFELIDIESDSNRVSATISDVTTQDPWGRMIHSSQFVYPVWSHFQGSEIQVKLFDKLGNWLVTTTGMGEDCEKVGKGEIPFEEMAKRVKFELSTYGKEIFKKNS